MPGEAAKGLDKLNVIMFCVFVDLSGASHWLFLSKGRCRAAQVVEFWIRTPVLPLKPLSRHIDIPQGPTRFSDAWADPKGSIFNI